MTGLFFSHKLRTLAQLFPHPSLLMILLSCQVLTLHTPFLFGLPDNTSYLFFPFSFFAHCNFLWLLPKVLILPISYDPWSFVPLKWGSKLIFSVMDPHLIQKNPNRGINIFYSRFQWGWYNSGFSFFCALNLVILTVNLLRTGILLRCLFSPSSFLCSGCGRFKTSMYGSLSWM